jgi:hypothetical protein
VRCGTRRHARMQRSAHERATVARAGRSGLFRFAAAGLAGSAGPGSPPSRARSSLRVWVRITSSVWQQRQPDRSTRNPTPSATHPVPNSCDNVESSRRAGRPVVTLWDAGGCDRLTRRICLDPVEQTAPRYSSPNCLHRVRGCRSGEVTLTSVRPVPDHVHADEQHPAPAQLRPHLRRDPAVPVGQWPWPTPRPPAARLPRKSLTRAECALRR